MIYGYDLAILLPVKDLYDSQIMLASIGAAKDMYEKGEKAIKDFNDKYEDFITPIEKDLNWYNLNVTGAAKNLINNLYAQGIDPTRSSEGRAAISRFINSVPKGDINKIKSSAEIAKEFLKSKQKLEQQGLWNPEFLKVINGGKSLEDWDTVGGDGVWKAVAATPYEDLTTFSNPQFDQLKPSSWTFTKNGMTYKQEGVREEDLQRVARENFADLITSPQGSFLYNKLLEQTGNPDDAKEAFTNMIAGSQTRRLFSSAAQIDPDWFKVQSLNLDKQRLALEGERVRIAKKDAEQKGSGKGGTERFTIFDSAKSSSIGKATYKVEDTKAHGITPVSNKVKATPIKLTVNKKVGDVTTSVSTDAFDYEFTDLDDAGIYAYDGNTLKEARNRKGLKNVKYKFSSDGDLQYVYDGKKDRFYVAGTLLRVTNAKGGNHKITSNTKDGIYYLEVKETRPNKGEHTEQIY